MPGQAIITIGDKQWAVGVASTFWELSQGLGRLAGFPVSDDFYEDFESFDDGSPDFYQCQVRAAGHDYHLKRLFFIMLRRMMAAPLTASALAMPQTTNAYSLASSSSAPVNKPDWPTTARPLRLSTRAPDINAQPILDEGNRIGIL